ncbi:MAG: LysR family transcriptional regulator, partial [Proteobacteria bacterium]
AVRHATIAGLDVAISIGDGRLVHLLPGWRGLQGIVHLVFTTRRGLAPAVRALIDHLATHFGRSALADW